MPSKKICFERNIMKRAGIAGTDFQVVVKEAKMKERFVNILKPSDS